MRRCPDGSIDIASMLMRAAPSNCETRPSEPGLLASLTVISRWIAIEGTESKIPIHGNAYDLDADSAGKPHGRGELLHPPRGGRGAEGRGRRQEDPLSQYGRSRPRRVFAAGAHGGRGAPGAPERRARL